MLDLTISIVSSTSELAFNCISSLLASLDGTITYEIWLVDNLSQDHLDDKIQSTIPEVRVLRNDSRKGFGANHNQILARANGRYVLLLNDDTIVKPGACQTLVHEADKYHGGGFFGPRLENYDGTLQLSAYRFPSPIRAICEAIYLHRLLGWVTFFDDYSRWKHDVVKKVEFLSGAALMVRSETIRQIGGLDEQFFMYAEETDWCLRGRRAGWDTMLLPQAHIVHLGGQSTVGLSAERSVEFLRSHTKFVRKHYGNLGLLVYKSSTLLKHTIKLLAYKLLKRTQEMQAVQVDIIMWSLGLLRRQGLSEVGENHVRDSLAALKNYQAFKFEYDPEKLQLITLRNRDFKLFVAPRYISHYVENNYEQFTATLLLNLMTDDTLFIDIGAHFGFYTVLAATQHRSCKVIAIEPVPENYAVLRKNIELNNLKNVDFYNIAASDREELKAFNVTEASDSCGFYQHPMSSTAKTIEVRTIAVDNLISNFQKNKIIIKIDMEGHEIHVLDGLQKSINGFDDIRLIVEFNPDCLKKAGFEPEALLQKIDSLGFDIYFIDDEIRRTYKLKTANLTNWRKYMRAQISYSNLLCIKKDKSLSVCFFSHTASWGGAEHFLGELTAELTRDCGVICTTITPGQGPLLSELGKIGVGTVTAYYDWWCSGTKTPIRTVLSQVTKSCASLFQYPDNLIALIDIINPDVIVTNTIVIPWGSICAMSLGKPHLWYVHEFGEKDHGLKFWMPFSQVIRYIKSTSHRILTDSNAVRHTLFGNCHEQKIETVYPHVDIGTIDEHLGTINYFKRANSLKLVIAGVVFEGKRQEDAIKAVQELQSRNIDAELIIMGRMTSDYARRMKEYSVAEKLEDCVAFLPFYEKPYEVMISADIVLMCSRMEACSRVTLEAMLLKKPVIGTKTGGTPEIIQDGYTGFLYEPGDYKSLTDKIQYFAEHRGKIAEFGENGYRVAKEKFSKDKFGGGVFQILMELKNSPHKWAPKFWTYKLFLIRHGLPLFANVINSVRGLKRKWWRALRR